MVGALGAYGPLATIHPITRLTVHLRACRVEVSVASPVRTY